MYDGPMGIFEGMIEELDDSYIEDSNLQIDHSKECIESISIDYSAVELSIKHAKEFGIL